MNVILAILRLKQLKNGIGSFGDYFFVGFSLFSFSHAEPGSQKLPEESRLKTGECFSQGLNWTGNDFVGLPDHLFKFCAATRAKPTHIQDVIVTKKLNVENVYAKIKKCLDDLKLGLIEKYKAVTPDWAKKHENDPEFLEINVDLIKKYKADMPDWAKELENEPKFPEINQVAVGFCQEKELVEYKNLSDDDKSTCGTCLKGCAEELFKKFEIIFKEFKKIYENAVEVEGEESPQSTPRPEYELTVNVDQYDETMNEFKVAEYDTLNIVGNEYAEKYIGQLDTLLENSPPDLETKELVFVSAESYYTCSRWKCAIAKASDVPMAEIIQNLIAKKSNKSNDLVTNWPSKEQ